MARRPIYKRRAPRETELRACRKAGGADLGGGGNMVQFYTQTPQ